MKIFFREIAVSIGGALLLAAVFVPGSATAQSALPGVLRLTEIKVPGLQRFSEAQVIAASALLIGQRADLDAIGAATGRLVNTGAFEKVSYRYRRHGDELAVVLDVIEAKKFLPCSFENFVWFSDDELLAGVRSKVPLFDGSAPAAGEMTTEIVDALQDMLNKRGIAGHAEFMPYGKLGGAFTRYLFQVTGIALPILEVRFPGAAAISGKDLQAAAHELIAQDYTRLSVELFVDAGLAPLYHERGYLHAQFGKPAAGMGAAGPADSSGVVLTIAVQEGLEYRFDGADWEGQHQFGAGDLSERLGLHPDEVANTKKIDAGITGIQHAYANSGFIEAAITPEPKLDDATRRARFHLQVTEGPQYLMGRVRFVGVTPGLAQHLESLWRLKPGAVFNASYPREFLHKDAAPGIGKRDPDSKGVQVTTHPDRQRLIVDVDITFL
jgi:outer membrane protein assembly factor BamA